MKLIKAMSFWDELPRHFSVLAPMEEVTDTAFRQVLCELGRPDVFFTEFTNVDGLTNEKGFVSVSQRLRFKPFEKPVVAQLWGTDPHKFTQAAQIVAKMGFDGIDINMGCPVKKIMKKGACGALIKTPLLAKQIYEATVAGSNGLPVSIKTRIGFSTLQTEEWIGYMLKEIKPTVLTVHARTVKEESKVANHFEQYELVAQLRDTYSPETKLIANGDILSLTQLKDICSTYGFQGGMIGRGVFHNPQVFTGLDFKDTSTEFKLQTLLKHVELFEAEWSGKKHFAILRRFFKIYATGFDGASELRVQLMETTCSDEVKTVIEKFYGRV
jgi:tRNA-dihydrouridine synthase